MRERFLNLNGVGAKILAICALLLLGIPALIWLLGQFGLRADSLAWAARLSLWAGGGLLLLFAGLVLLEHRLDERLYRRYRRSLDQRIPHADGTAECPHCGCRGIKEFESSCPVCGSQLKT
jgi:hypothetical protein